MVMFHRGILALAVVLLLGGCVSDSKANSPLPRMSKEKAEERAKQWTVSMARTAKAEIDTKSVDVSFTNCIGKNNESADDGRFNLSYNVRAELSKSQHSVAVRAIRDALKGEGFEIVGYRSDPEVRPVNLVDARHPKSHQFVSAGDISDELLTLIVKTPCLLPPGVEQQEF